MKLFTPKIGIIIIILLVISAAALVLNRNNNTSTSSPVSGTPQSSSDSTLAASAEKKGNIGEYYDGTKSAASSSATPFPKPDDIRVYTYPSSTVKSSTSLKLELESTYEPDKITDWYKNKIRELNFNARSFSQVTTNGNVFNKLTAAKPGEKIDITIKKDQTTSKVLITVDRL